MTNLKPAGSLKTLKSSAGWESDKFKILLAGSEVNFSRICVDFVTHTLVNFQLNSFDESVAAWRRQTFLFSASCLKFSEDALYLDKYPIIVWFCDSLYLSAFNSIFYGIFVSFKL